MKTINVDLSSGEALNLLVGRQGESGVTQVVFNFSALKTEFGTGTVSLSVKRPKEPTPYAQTITVDGTDATWLVNETDTGVAGCGEIQLTYTVNSQIAKTVVYKYTVYPSIGVDGEYPIPGQTWQQEIEEDIADIKEDLSDLQEEIEGGGGGSGMSAEFKQALHNILEKVAYIDDDGQDYLNALDSAMYPPVTAISLNTNSLSFAALNSTQQLTATTTPSGGAVTWTSSNTSIATVSSTGLVTSKGYGNATITASSGSVSATCSIAVTQATLSSISAVYTQSGTVYDTDSLDSLKTDLVVTAHWSNSTTTTVPSTDYTLSGTLTEGTSTITVSYGGKTTTFNVVVSTRQTVVIPHIGEMGSDGFKSQAGDGTKNVFLYSGSTSGYYQLWSADVPQNSVIHLDFEEIYSANVYVAIVATGTSIDSSANGTYYPDIGTITQDFTSLSGNLDNSLLWETGSVTGSTAYRFGLTDDAYFTMPITGKIVLGIRAASFKANSEQSASTTNLRNYVNNNNFSFYYI